MDIIRGIDNLFLLGSSPADRTQGACEREVYNAGTQLCNKHSLQNLMITYRYSISPPNKRTKLGFPHDFPSNNEKPPFCARVA